MNSFYDRFKYIYQLYLEQKRSLITDNECVVSKGNVLMEDVSYDVMKELEEGVTNLFESNTYKNYLDVMSKFYNYSFNNNLLIAMQRPDATRIASYTAWKEEFGRNVKKGEKGINIIAPVMTKELMEKQKNDPKTNKPLFDENGNPVMEKKEYTKTTFRVVKVFDISQTEGKELPEILHKLNGTTENANEMLNVLGMISPVPLRVGNISGSANGYYSSKNKEIVIRDGLSDVQSIKTCVHEISHAMLHDRDLLDKARLPLPDARAREVQAESIAYAVCKHFGIDTSEYSFGYIAGWSKDKELSELKTSMNTIRYTANKIINQVEKELFPEKEKIFEKAQEVKEVHDVKSEGKLLGNNGNYKTFGNKQYSGNRYRSK